MWFKPGERFPSCNSPLANDYTLIIQLDDNPLMGPDWYEIDLGDQTLPTGDRHASPRRPTPWRSIPQTLCQACLSGISHSV